MRYRLLPMSMWVLCIVLLAGRATATPSTTLSTTMDVSSATSIPELPSELGPPGPPPLAEQIDAVTHDIASGLRCPVCQGLSTADSPSATAVTMKARIRALVAVGYTRPQIEAYFVQRYGEWILLQPPTTGISWLLWLGPGALMLAAFAWAGVLAVSWRKTPDDVPLPSDLGLVPKDPYEEKLLRELEERP